MDCPNCGAHMEQEQDADTWKCPYCGSLHTVEKNEDDVRVFSETSPYKCPVCGVTLAEGTMHGYHLFYCGRCRGSLIPVEAFVALLDELRAEQAGSWHIGPRADPQELERELHCPKCGRRMDTHFYGGPGNVVIDDCAGCELNWFDRGELWRIVRAPQELS